MQEIVYQARQFRDGLSEAFDHVISGNRVLISRRSQKFELSYPREDIQKLHRRQTSITKRIEHLEKHLPKHSGKKV